MDEMSEMCEIDEIQRQKVGSDNLVGVNELSLN